MGGPVQIHHHPRVKTQQLRLGPDDGLLLEHVIFFFFGCQISQQNVNTKLLFKALCKWQFELVNTQHLLKSGWSKIYSEGLYILGCFCFGVLGFFYMTQLPFKRKQRGILPSF